MSWAADDLFDAAMREQEQRDALEKSCECKGWHWFQNDDGMYECRECGEVVDL